MKPVWASPGMKVSLWHSPPLIRGTCSPFPADRAAILRIKHVICQHPDYRGNVYNSMAIYRAALEDKVESVDEFNAWLEKTHANT